MHRIIHDTHTTQFLIKVQVSSLDDLKNTYQKEWICNFCQHPYEGMKEIRNIKATAAINTILYFFNP